MSIGSSFLTGEAKPLFNAGEPSKGFSAKSQIFSKQQLKDMNLFQDFNSSSDASIFMNKSLTFEGMNKKIENALNQLLHFQRQHPERDRAGQRNVDQAIVSLSSSLKETKKKHDKNLSNLKKHRIGQKVVETKESKHS